MVVALVGGVAWAETQVVATPPGQGATVVAVLVPGPGGGEVCGDTKGDDHVKFNIGGDIVVNGEVCAGNDPHASYTVTFNYRHEMGLWLLDITVENNDLRVNVPQREERRTVSHARSQLAVGNRLFQTSPAKPVLDRGKRDGLPRTSRVDRCCRYSL